MNVSFRLPILGVAFAFAMSAACQAEVRIKDVTQVYGTTTNKLVGSGLVVGLNGTGARSLSTQQMAIDMLRKMDMTTKLARQSILDNVFKSSSIAHVMVTAELPPFARKGSTLDVTVSVLDDSQSLEGGTLIMTPLYGADRQVYATAQGSLSIGGFRVRSNVPGSQQNHPTVARLQAGANVEKEELGHIDQGGCVKLLLKNPDSSTAKSIMLAINRQYPATARTIDAGMVQIRIPTQRQFDLTDFVSEISQISILPDSEARIVINERTGTVIVGNQVRISAVQIAHGNLSIKPNVSLIPTPPPPAADEGNDAPPQEGSDPVDEILKSLRPRPLPGIQPSDKPIILHNVDQTFTVGDLARVLNALGASPRDLIAIFQALKASGAMHADLIVM